MKKLFLFLMLMAGTLTAQAADYTYLTFETTDGAKVSVEASSLTVAISGTTLTNATPVYSGAAVHIQNGKRIYVSDVYKQLEKEET